MTRQQEPAQRPSPFTRRAKAPPPANSCAAAGPQQLFPRPVSADGGGNFGEQPAGDVGRRSAGGFSRRRRRRRHRPTDDGISRRPSPERLPSFPSRRPRRRAPRADSATLCGEKKGAFSPGARNPPRCLTAPNLPRMSKSTQVLDRTQPVQNVEIGDRTQPVPNVEIHPGA